MTDDPPDGGDYLVVLIVGITSSQSGGTCRIDILQYSAQLVHGAKNIPHTHTVN